MKPIFLFGLLLLSNPLVYSQQDLPEFQIKESEVNQHLNFLASDEMQGRNTATVYADIAARYIAEQFRSYGLSPIGDHFFQNVPMIKSTPNTQAEIQHELGQFVYGENLALFSDNTFDREIEVVFAKHGWVDATQNINDYEGLNVMNKLVVVIPGTDPEDNPTFTSEQSLLGPKIGNAMQNGAVGLLEVFPFGRLDWERVINFITQPSFTLGDLPTPGAFPILGMILPDQKTFFAALKESEQPVKIKFSQVAKTEKSPVVSKNIVGMIEGTDPVLKNEYLLLSAHYDHVGVKAAIRMNSVALVQDTIFNGSRDNAMGTIALLMAAKSLAANPPKRSVIFAAFTAEEVGLLGSAYYADHPLKPLANTVYNLNADGAGYNDTTLVTIFGYNEVAGMDILQQGCTPFGLQVRNDPAPEQNLFQRSDNFSFANKGVPAPTFSVGFTAFDEEIMTYYHQVEDNPNTINLNYLLRYSQAFAHSARILGNMDETPFWQPGSAFEAKGKALYGKE